MRYFSYRLYNKGTNFDLKYSYEQNSFQRKFSLVIYEFYYPKFLEFDYYEINPNLFFDFKFYGFFNFYRSCVCFSDSILIF